MSLIAQIGFIITFIGSLMLLYRFVQFGLVVLFGKNLTLTYVDKNGVKCTKHVRVGKDDELVNLLAEIKAATRNKNGGLN